MFPLPAEHTLAWHFVGTTLRDGRPIPADGEVLAHEGPVVPCESGLHWSERVLDALTYAPGPILTRVAVWGDDVRADDKGASRFRVILWRIDATEVLFRFARQCALDVIHKWNAPQVVRDFLTTGDASLRDAAVSAAADAARASAQAADPGAAIYAALAACDAVRAAGPDAVLYAAFDASAHAAAAAGDSSLTHHNDLLVSMVMDAMVSARAEQTDTL